MKSSFVVNKLYNFISLGSPSPDIFQHFSLLPLSPKKQQEMEEVSTKGSWGHHPPSDQSTSDICLQFMWHPPSADIWANLPTASTNNWDSRDLDTETPYSEILSSLFPLGFLTSGIPWYFYDRSSLPPYHCHCSEHYSHSGPPYSMCNVCPRSTSTLSASLLPHYTFSTGWPGSPHGGPSLTHCTVADSQDHLPESHPHCSTLLHILYAQPVTKPYQVTIWGRLSPTDINVGTWIFWGS